MTSTYEKSANCRMRVHNLSEHQAAERRLPQPSFPGFLPAVIPLYRSAYTFPAFPPFPAGPVVEAVRVHVTDTLSAGDPEVALVRYNSTPTPFNIEGFPTFPPWLLHNPHRKNPLVQLVHQSTFSCCATRKRCEVNLDTGTYRVPHMRRKQHNTGTSANGHDISWQPFPDRPTTMQFSTTVGLLREG